MFQRRSLLALLLPLVLPVAAAAQQPAASEKASGKAAMAAVSAASLEFAPISVPGFVPGLEIAVVNGDPNKEGAYTLRLRLPAGYAFPAHWHPNTENLTVLSGTFYLAMGDKTAPAELKKYVPGDYLYLPAKMPHFGRVDGETIVQLHGQGPFAITVTEQIEGAAK